MSLEGLAQIVGAGTYPNRQIRAVFSLKLRAGSLHVRGTWSGESLKAYHHPPRCQLLVKRRKGRLMPASVNKVQKVSSGIIMASVRTATTGVFLLWVSPFALLDCG